MNYKVILAYDGTRYNGWQRQGNTDRTIQGKLEQILTRMSGEKVEVFWLRTYGCRGSCRGTDG